MGMAMAMDNACSQNDWKACIPFMDRLPSTRCIQMRLNELSVNSASFSAAGLIVLADLSTIAERTALTGSTSILDTLFLSPGIHRQQAAAEANRGELPATGAMTTGYVFRIENQATIAYLQRIGHPGCLVTVRVDKSSSHTTIRWIRNLFSPSGFASSTFYLAGIWLSISSLSMTVSIGDRWAFSVLCILIFARFLNMLVLKRRTQFGWKGISEPGVEGDLLVLLSQDRWVRIQGLVDDLKAVTAGQWLRDPTTVEGFATAFATLLVYVSAAVASNASGTGCLIILTLMLVSASLLGLANAFTRTLQMFGRTVSVVAGPKYYHRRLDMANEMIENSGRSDWAVSMGLILPQAGQDGEKVTM
jgi:hypothetical protein